MVAQTVIILRPTTPRQIWAAAQIMKQEIAYKLSKRIVLAPQEHGWLDLAQQLGWDVVLMPRLETVSQLFKRLVPVQRECGWLGHVRNSI